MIEVAVIFLLVKRAEELQFHMHLQYAHIIIYLTHFFCWGQFIIFKKKKPEYK